MIMDIVCCFQKKPADDIRDLVVASETVMLFFNILFQFIFGKCLHCPINYLLLIN